MFTQGKHLNILDNNEFVVVLVENGAIDEVPDILFVTLGEIHHGLGVTLWCLPQSFSFWVFSNALEDCSYSACKLLYPFFHLLWG